MSRDSSMISLRDIYPNYTDAPSIDDKAALSPADQKELNPDQVKTISNSTKSTMLICVTVFGTLIALYHVKGAVGA
jgi:hypothetical protein